MENLAGASAIFHSCGFRRKDVGHDKDLVKYQELPNTSRNLPEIPSHLAEAV